jgi:hypothetical protein
MTELLDRLEEAVEIAGARANEMVLEHSGVGAGRTVADLVPPDERLVWIRIRDDRKGTPTRSAKGMSVTQPFWAS